MALLTGPTKLGLIVYLIFLWIFGLVVSSHTSEVADLQVYGVSQAIKLKLAETAPRHWLINDIAERRHLAEAIVAASRRYDIDPYLLTAMAYCESTFRREAIGSRGERGLIQVGRGASRGCDLTTDIGQLECGASWLRRGIDRCGSLHGGLTAYATGKCKTDNPKVIWVVNRRLKMAKRLKQLGGE